jgi:hypothetical protein
MTTHSLQQYSMDASQISPDTMLPDLLAAFPQVRRVFDRYGLRGCGGKLGPVESVGFFARTHGVEQDRLLSEVRQAIDSPADDVEAAPASVADTLYRRFFTAGIILILTAGATWGAWLLWRIGIAGNFTAISIHDVNAHGHAQIFGWVGLFIMGFAYQAFPRIWHTDLHRPRLALAAFGMMVVGLIIRTVGMTAAGQPWALSLATAGGALEIASVLIFVWQILMTYRAGQGKLEPYIGFVVMALFWFIAMSVMCVWHMYMTMTAPTRERLLWFVATYQAPLRDLQIHGLALFMILGVSLRMLPALFGVPQVSNRRAWWALGILTAAVAGESILFVIYRWTHNHALAGALMLPWLMLIIGVAMVALPWKLWRPMPDADRSAKFVRAAYVWLAISLVMLLLLPVYQLASGIAFSHAYYGAIRHAITVGFISLMIMGIAAKVVPTLNGIDTRTLSALWGPFILINIGCFLRVSVQTLTDFHGGFFAVVGISGTLEVAALAWWGVGLVRIMRAGKREETLADRPAIIRPDHVVAHVAEWYPQTLPVFDQFGFGMIRNPVLRRTVARGVTLRQATGMHSVNTDQFVEALNTAIGACATRCDSGCH